VWLAAACAATPAGTTTPAADPSLLHLEANVPLPPSWAANRPTADAALIIRQGRRIILYLQIDPMCSEGIHAHRSAHGDTLQIKVHYGLDNEVQDPYRCFTSCDFYCPILYRSTLTFHELPAILHVFLRDTLFTEATFRPAH
jgi:hypothetical protein